MSKKELSKYGTGVRGVFKVDNKTGEVIFTEKQKPVIVNAPAVHQDTLSSPVMACRS